MRAEQLPYDVLGVQGIARTLLARPQALAGFTLPSELAQIPVPSERFLPEERAALAESLLTNLAPLAPHAAVLEGLRSLQRPGACVVIAGQQPGFLASPLYNLHKALHVVRLARALAQAWERPVLPLFWNHADDHDLAEVHHAFVANENHDLQKIGLSGMSSGRLPFSRVVLSEGRHRLSGVRSTLEELHRGEPHVGTALDIFCPRDGESLARAFTRAMSGLLGHMGLILLEPDWIRPSLSRALAQLVGRTRPSGEARDFLAALRLGAEEVRALGHAPQIDPADAALVYRVDEQGRHALRAGGDGMRYDGEEGSRNLAELAAEIVQDPSSWSPSALTRPIVQDACLPVAAYVGGLGELDYHAQLGPLRDFAGVPRTPFVPRFACTLIETDVEASLAKLGTGAEEVLRARGVVEPALDATEPAVLAELRAIAQRASRELVACKPALAELDPGLAANLKRTGDQIRALVERMCEKGARVHQNKSGKGQRHYRRVANALYPRDAPQERVLGPLSFVARHGVGWIDELLECVPPLPRGHTLAYLGEPAAG